MVRGCVSPILQKESAKDQVNCWGLLFCGWEKPARKESKEEGSGGRGLK